MTEQSNCEYRENDNPVFFRRLVIKKIYGEGKSLRGAIKNEHTAWFDHWSTSSYNIFFVLYSLLKFVFLRFTIKSGVDAIICLWFLLWKECPDSKSFETAGSCNSKKYINGTIIDSFVSILAKKCSFLYCTTFLWDWLQNHQKLSN